MTITLADLQAKGFVIGPDGTVTRPPRIAVRTGGVICFDPSLNDAGGAALRWTADGLEWFTDSHGCPRGLQADDLSCPFGDANGIFNAKLRTLRAFGASFVRSACNAFSTSDLTVLIEGAYYRGNRDPSPESILKYGIAVGAVSSGAARLARDVWVVPPDWTKGVLCGRKGRAPKLERWKAARDLVTSIHGSGAWADPQPEDIKPKSAHSHVADAKAMAVAWAYRAGAFAP